MSLRENLTDAALASHGSKATIAGGTTAFIGGMSANEIAAYGGLLIALIGLLVNWHYRRKSDRRERERHRLEVERLTRTP